MSKEQAWRIAMLIAAGISGDGTTINSHSGLDQARFSRLYYWLQKQTALEAKEPV